MSEPDREEEGCMPLVLGALLAITLLFGSKFVNDRLTELEDRVDVLEEQVDVLEEQVDG